MENANTQHTKASLLRTSSGEPLLIAGPCSAETEEQLIQTALQIKERTTVHIFRAGIWKPRTRPNSFEGVGRPGLSWLQQVKQLTGLPVACEVANSRHVAEALAHDIDVLWIGARTSVNPFSVQEIADALAGTDKTVLVKNPINPDLGLWMGAIERLQKAGIKEIGAIHRGFSISHSTTYRNAPKWRLAQSFREEMPEIPLLCDPSHLGGRRDVLQELSQQALNVGMDGLMIESHISPDAALSDAKQQITPTVLAELLRSLRQPGATSAALHVPDELAHEMDCLDNELLELLSQRAKLSGELKAQPLTGNLTQNQAQSWDSLLHKLTHRARLEDGSLYSLFGQLNEYLLKELQAQPAPKP